MIWLSRRALRGTFNDPMSQVDVVLIKEDVFADWELRKMEILKPFLKPGLQAKMIFLMKTDGLQK